MGNAPLAAFRVAVCVGLVLSARAARGDSVPTSRLTYLRAGTADSCPDEAALRAAVASRIGYDPFFPWARRTVVARIEQRQQRFLGHIWVVDERGLADGERELASDAPSCAALFETMAMDISLAIQAQATEEATPTTTSTEASPAKENAASDSPPPAPRETVAAPPSAGRDRLPVALKHPGPDGAPGKRPSFLLGGGARSSLGVSPAVAWGAEAFASVRFGVVSAGAGVYGEPATSGSVSPPGASVTTSVVAAEASPCLHAAWAAFCGVVSYGIVRGTATGVPGVRAASTFFAAAGGGLAAEWQFSPPFVLRGHGEVQANLHRAVLLLGGEPAWAASTVLGSLGADVAVRF